ncbi:protein naked cuticle homolog [Culex pipiens pallens]|uniref:protein naked cuticle homolog n=1 Tax=Culex pipiens pallens TaxID=42434 RepID=UPI0019531C86|nr:protein naked cuticle homolog [Culex pipiens pallens]
MRRKLRQSMRPFMVKLSSMVESTVLPVATLTPSRILQHHVAHAKANKKEQRLAVTNRAHGHQGKLSTAVLNQQYPNLSAGGRAGRTVRPPDGYRPQACDLKAKRISS